MNGRRKGRNRETHLRGEERRTIPIKTDERERRERVRKLKKVFIMSNQLEK